MRIMMRDSTLKGNTETKNAWKIQGEETFVEKNYTVDARSSANVISVSPCRVQHRIQTPVCGLPHSFGNPQSGLAVLPFGNFGCPFV